MKKFFILILLSISSNYSIAQIPDYIKSEYKGKSENAKIKRAKVLKSDNVAKTYDVLKYSLFMDWSKPLRAALDKGSDRHFNAVNDIKIKIGADYIGAISFNALNLRIDSVYVNSVKENFNPTITSQTLDFNFGSRFNIGDTANIKIYYKYIGDSNNLTTDGLVLFNKGERALEKIMYTMSEPYYAREWMPCNDNPDDKAIAEIDVKTPNDFVCVSNGLCVDTVIDGNDLIWKWRDTTPITTYLMHVAVSKYKTFTEYYKRIANPQDSVPILYAYWEADEKAPYDALGALAPTAGLMGLYSRFYGEYPFIKYGMVAVSPFSYGGMEHQTISTIARNWLSGYYEEGIAHELAHQWFGDKITCATWHDLWINEGGATFSEVLWAEQVIGKEYGYVNKLSKKKSYIENVYNIGPIRGDMFSYNLTYCKSAWFYLMLRYLVGEEKFYPALRNVLNKYAYKSLSLEEFKSAFAEIAPNPAVNYDTFYAQWLDSVWHPNYNVTPINSVKSGDKYETMLRVRQTQQGVGVPNVFIMPIKVQFLSRQPYRDTTIIYLNNQREAIYTALLDFKADSVILDPDSEILCEIETSGFLPVVETKSKFNANIFPNPILSGENAQLFINTIGESLYVEISVFNNLGEKVEDLYRGELTNDFISLPINTNNLPSGAYFINANSNSKREIIKFAITK